MWPFKRKPKPPLEEAIRMVEDAIEIAYRYKRDCGHIPTETELQQLDRLAQTLWEGHSAAQYVARYLHQRNRGEHESAKKFSEPDVAEHPYPLS